MSTDDAAQHEAARDARDLRRGVFVNFLGALLKLSNPVLLVFVVRFYGAAEFGLFSIAQPVMLFAARVAVLGLDKGLLWWIPQQDDAAKSLAIGPALRLCALASLVITALFMSVRDPTVLSVLGVSPESTRYVAIMSLGIFPQVAMDLWTHATMGLRRMGAQVFIKETLVPLVLVVAALALYFTDVRENGIPYAFVLSNLAGCAASYVAFRRVFPRREQGARVGVRSETFAPVLRYSIPYWFAEMANSFFQRMDQYAVALMVDDLALVGVYGVVVRISNMIRAIRRSFDSIVLAIVSEISVVGDKRKQSARLTGGFSYAVLLVTLAQLPVFVFLLAFADLLMPLYGEGFEAGTVPVLILSSFWLFNGVSSLAGTVVSAFGQSRVTFYTVVFGVVVQAICSVLLIPPYGIIGAALSVGISYTLQTSLQVVLMRTITGGWNYNRTVLWPFIIGVVACAAMAIAWWAALALPLGRVDSKLGTRVVAFVAFAIFYGAGVYWLLRTGRLAGPAPDRAIRE